MISFLQVMAIWVAVLFRINPLEREKIFEQTGLADTEKPGIYCWH